MKIGDIVKWIGFPGADAKGIRATGPNVPGIIISMYVKSYRMPPRIDVMWGDGTIGRQLYMQTIKVIGKDK